MPTIRRGTLGGDLPTPGAHEHVDTLALGRGARIERIVSHGQASPTGFWYDQADDEWVLVVSGHAVLGFADGHRETLATGDWIWLPAGCRHRVEETCSPTIWLAIHLPPVDTKASEL